MRHPTFLRLVNCLNQHVFEFKSKVCTKKNQQNFGTLRKKVGVCILNIWKLGQKKMLQLSYKTLFYRFPKVLRCSFSWSFPFDTLNKNIDLSSRGHQPCEHVNPPRSAWWRSLRPRPRWRLSCDKMALLESQIGRRVQMRHSKRRLWLGGCACCSDGYFEPLSGV